MKEMREEKEELCFRQGIMLSRGSRVLRQVVHLQVITFAPHLFEGRQNSQILKVHSNMKHRVLTWEAGAAV